MKLKKGDKVFVLTGKDRGKTGKILQIFTNGKRASVEGINITVKHLRPGKQREKGQKIQFPAPMYTSKLMLVCSKCDKPTRFSFKILDNKSKVRVCKRCKETI